MDDTTLLQRLSSRTPEPSEVALAAAAARLDARIAAATAQPSIERHARRPQVLRRGGLIGLGIGAATCATVLLCTAGPTPTASAEVTRTLQAAAAAASTHDAVPGTTTTHVLQLVTSSSGRTQDASGGLLIDSSVAVERTTTLRKAADGDGWERGSSASNPVQGWGPVGDALAKQIRDDPEGGPSVARSSSDPNFWSGPTSLSPAQVRAMPRDPDALVKTLGGITDPDSALEANTNRVIDAASALLGSGLADADLQAATYRALEKLPGLTVDEHGRDIDGRAGVAIGATVSNGLQRIDLIIDPSTGRFLGRTETNLTATGGAPAGTVEEASAVFTR
jgi:hypothetical protein